MSLTPYQDALDKHVTVREAAKAMKIARSTFFDKLNKEKSTIVSTNAVARPRKVACHNGKDVKRYIFTCVVREAKVHQDFLHNLEVYAKHVGAKLVIGTLSNRGRHQLNAEFDINEYPEEVRPYLTRDAIVLGDKIRFCPELNLTPAMIKPLVGLHTYTKKLWSIFPHPKICVETVATHKGKPTKFCFTTGALTHPCYSVTKAGFRAQFDHVFGAVIVEVSKRGVWVRHLIPTSHTDGSFYDLGWWVYDGTVFKGSGVKAIVYGDIHAEQIDEACAKATWGLGCGSDKHSLARMLMPEIQVFHDLMDMTAINYHELDNVFSRFDRWYNQENGAKDDFTDALGFMEHVEAFADQNIVVDSNHDMFVKKWLQVFDPSKYQDFANIATFYELKLAVLAAIRKGKPFSFLEVALQTVLKYQPTAASTLENFQFLKRDESYEIMGIECSYHGHYGVNGSRGSRAQFKFVSEKSIIGHSHSPGVESGCYQVGTSSKLDLNYNNGPSSWAHTHAVVYPNGMRTLVTMSDGKLWADQ